jgi:hypothetical protein
MSHCDKPGVANGRAGGRKKRAATTPTLFGAAKSSRIHGEFE